LPLQNSKEIKDMKIQALLLGAVVATFASSAFASQTLHSPRAAGNEIKVVSSTAEGSAITVALANADAALLSPRSAGNQTKAVKGLATDVNPALVCRENMNGTPKAVTECSSHANMPGCMTASK
jgi:hypothetical protein